MGPVVLAVAVALAVGNSGELPGLLFCWAAFSMLP